MALDDVHELRTDVLVIGAGAAGVELRFHDWRSGGEYDDEPGELIRICLVSHKKYPEAASG